MSAHTPTPWDYVQGGRTKLCHVETRHDNPHGAGLPVCSIPAKREHDADRIVECVNACAGIADPADAIQAARRAIQFCIQAMHTSGITSVPGSLSIQATADASAALAKLGKT